MDVICMTVALKNGKGEHSKFIYETPNALITKTMEDIRKQQTNISYEYK